MQGNPRPLTSKARAGAASTQGPKVPHPAAQSHRPGGRARLLRPPPGVHPADEEPQAEPVAFFLARPTRDDLGVLRDLLLAGKISPVIDRTYPLSEVPEAISYLEQGHASGKAVITV